jgi:hypothetical protein
MKTRLSGGKSGPDWDDIFIAVEGGSRTIRGGWPVAVVRIQCFSFGSRKEATGRSVAERWSEASELILSLWEGSVTRGSVVISAGREATLGRKKGGDDTSWADVNPIGLKNEENPRGRFSRYKMNGENLKQWWVNLIFFWKYMQVRYSFVHRIA